VDGDGDEVGLVGGSLAARHREVELLRLNSHCGTSDSSSYFPTPPPDPEFTNRNISGRVYIVSACMAVLKR
jgi:hypothetical protein